MLRVSLWTVALPALAATALAAADVPRLQPPVKLLADGQPFHVEVGHAAPYVYDFDKDGKKDLLVGQFGDGKCRIYLNQGTDESPEFKDFQWLMADGAPARTDPG